MDPLLNRVLPDVSRSFYLTIRALPPHVREPVGIAYLLARASDTLADEASAPAEVRLRWLDQFARAVEGGGVVPQVEAPGAAAGEKVLLDNLGECVARLEGLQTADRVGVRHVLREIVRGQRLDVERFKGAMAALPDAASLDEYTYLVAGSVGEFWTRLCARHLPRYASVEVAPLTALGISFGKGLQLVNVLRDLRADLEKGRCYLPADELAAVGTEPARLLLEPEQARPVVRRWIGIAQEHLNDAFRYIEAVRPVRIRFACVLPWRLGVRTLQLLREHPPLETGSRLKVPRTEVRWTMLLCAGAAFSNAMLRRLRA